MRSLTAYTAGRWWSLNLAEYSSSTINKVFLVIFYSGSFYLCIKEQTFIFVSRKTFVIQNSKINLKKISLFRVFCNHTSVQAVYNRHFFFHIICLSLLVYARVIVNPIRDNRSTYYQNPNTDTKGCESETSKTNK